MRIWIDDLRPAPQGFTWCQTVDGAKDCIEACEFLTAQKACMRIELIDIDHDAGDYVGCGGDYIKLLDWLEETGRNYPIRIHSMNPVGVANMRAIIQRNGWTEIR